MKTLFPIFLMLLIVQTGFSADEEKKWLPLPIPLTKEQDAQLVEEGILPPVKGGPKGVVRNIETNNIQQNVAPLPRDPQSDHSDEEH